MSASFYDLLKYAATSIASPDMTYYDKLRASTLMGGTVQRLTGQPPLTFKADGTPLISWSMLGNGEQSGTPSPDNIIMPTFCGVRTGNLVEGYIPNCNINASGGLLSNPDFNMFYARVEQGKTYCADVSLLGGYFATIPEIGKTSYDGQRLAFVQSPFTAPITGYLAFRKTSSNTEAMMNEGQTLQNYEPFGYKITITNAGQTTPVYLGEVPTVRRVRKLVLDGTSNFTSVVVTGGLAFVYNPVLYPPNKWSTADNIISSHYKSEYSNKNGNIYFTTARLIIVDFRFETVDAFKAYIAQQYSNGTPVTIWYILAEPTTGIVNEPLAKIGDYCDELHSEDAGVTIPTAKGSNTLTVDTTLQPSEMSITYRE